MVTRLLQHHQALHAYFTQEEAGRAKRLALLFWKDHPPQGLPPPSYWPEYNHIVSSNSKRTGEINLGAHCQQEQNQRPISGKMGNVFGEGHQQGYCGVTSRITVGQIFMASQSRWFLQ